MSHNFVKKWTLIFIAAVMLLTWAAAEQVFVSDSLKIALGSAPEESADVETEGIVDEAAAEGENTGTAGEIEPEDTQEELELAGLVLTPAGSCIAGSEMEIAISLKAGNTNGTLLRTVSIVLDTPLDCKPVKTDCDGVDVNGNTIILRNAQVAAGELIVGGKRVDLVVKAVLPADDGKVSVEAHVLDSRGKEIEPDDKQGIGHLLTVNVLPAKEETQEEERQPVVLEMELSADPKDLCDGDVLTMTAVIKGLDSGTYTILWQCDGGKDIWQPVEGAVGTEYSVVISPETRGCSWRYIVDAE